MQVLVLAKGALAVYQAVCAMATGREMMKRDKGGDICLQPALQPNPQTRRDTHAIRMYLYRTSAAESASEFSNISESSSPMMISKGWRTKGSSGEGSSSAAAAVAADGEPCDKSPGLMRGRGRLRRAVAVRVAASTDPRRLAGSIAALMQQKDGPGLDSGKHGGGCIVEAAGAIAVYR